MINLSKGYLLNMSLSITSFSFFIFATFILVIYFIVPKYRWIVLFVASCLYYGYVSNWYVGPIAVSVGTLWFGSVYIDKINQQKKKLGKSEEDISLKEVYKKRSKVILCVIIGINLGLLFFYKFAPNTILPLAISFYTLSGIGYIVDVYKGSEAERNICKLSLLLCFFPIVIQGPVVRYKKLRMTLYRDNHFDIHQIISGLILVCWGGIKKLVIADRVYPLVNGVFSDYNTYSGFIILVAVVGYVIQLYCDFSGGIDIIIGWGTMFGISLPENFKQPYFATSVSEFWRRWHISLGNWFKDYIYMPIAMSKLNNLVYGKLKNRFGTMAAKIITSCAITFIVWIMNGIWHGAGWKYVVFGAYMGILIAIDNLRKSEKRSDCLRERWIHLAKNIRTLIFVAIGWMLIRVNTLSDFPKMIAAIFTKNSNGIIENVKYFWSDMDCAILAYGVILLVIVEILQTRQSIRERVSNAKPIVQVIFWNVMIFTWLVLSYDAGDAVRGFIYAKF